MINIPSDLLAKYKSFIVERAITGSLYTDYIKWLRYFLDFCNKYNYPDNKNDSLSKFVKKLRQKNQDTQKQKQAINSILLYFELLKKNQTKAENNPSKTINSGNTKYIFEQSFTKNNTTDSESEKDTGKTPLKMINFPDSGSAKSVTAAWNKAIEDLAAEIQIRHYSPRTLEAYSIWVKKFRGFMRNKDPHSLTVTDVKEYMKYLAVRQNVSASTQNQAFNGLLFFFKYILKKEIDNKTDIIRAKSRPYIPVVLSREEIDIILSHLSYPYDLIVKLLYGCGLRLFECLNLRILNFNFDAGILTVHDGKGKKDRTIPLPQSVMPELMLHLEMVKVIHQKDLDAGYAGAFMTGLSDKKYRNSSKELVWQWFFPAKMLTLVPDKKEYRRYYLHKTHVPRAVKIAVRKS